MRGNFVILRAGSLRLLLDQQDVGAAEYVEPHELPEGAVALSSRMEPLTEFPRDRFVLTRIAAGGASRAFAWDEARVLIDAQVERHPLPRAIQVDDAPVNAYVVHEGELLLCTQARHLLRAAGER